MLFYFICRSVLHACLPTYLGTTCMPGTPKARRGHWMLWNCSHRCLWAAVWVLAVNTRSSGRVPVLFNAELSLGLLHFQMKFTVKLWLFTDLKVEIPSANVDPKEIWSISIIIIFPFVPLREILRKKLLIVSSELKLFSWGLVLSGSRPGTQVLR